MRVRRSASPACASGLRCSVAASRFTANPEPARWWRQGFQRMLAREEGLKVVGEAEDGREAIELCSRLRPDLVLMDVRMPKMDGLVATREIKQRHPETSVLMVTMQENPQYLLEAVKAGAAGYVLKGSPNNQIMSGKLGVSDRTQAAVRAAELGLLAPKSI